MCTRWFLPILILCLLAPAAWAMTPAEQLEVRLQADQASNQGEFAGAAELYEKLLPHQPENGALLYNLAMAQFRSGNMQGAKQNIELALELGHGRKARVYFEIAQSAARESDPATAMRFLKMTFADRYEQAADIMDVEAFASLHDHPEFKALVGIPPANLDRKAGWSHDLDFFLQEVRRMHVDFDGYGFSPDIEADIAALRGRIDELTNEEVAIEIQRMIAKLGDGHSSLWGIPGERVRFPSLPVKLYYFSDGLFVTDANDAYKDLIGAKVTAIGDRSADHLLDDFAPFCSRDNEHSILGTTAVYARRTAMLKMLGYSEHDDRATVTFELTSGKAHTVTIEAATRNYSSAFGAAGGLISDETPLWLRKTDDSYWHQDMPELSALYVQFNSVSNKDDGPSLSEYAASVREVLGTQGYRHLIVDVRNNGGGNNFLIWPMIRVLTAHADASPENRVWIITSRRTYSACQNFVNFADRITEPIFVGEPSGSKPNFIGETGRVRLQWSGLRLSLSSRYWQDSFPNDRRQYIPMDMPVALSSQDYFGNVDPVMVALKDVLGNGAGNEGSAAE